VHEAASYLRRVRDLGCRVALDDFGAAYNGFARVTRLPIDVLKIDRQFVAGLLHDRGSASVVKAIVGLAADLGTELIAEGVEDAATADRLRELGVGAAQGFHLGRPAPLT
jgi:EAL domain-containing protein (putative c-di-GMP-specific phosphodiesterase class I)